MVGDRTDSSAPQSDGIARRGADRRLPDDDPWKLALGRALDGLSGKIVTVDVWHLLGLHPYDSSIQEQRRLT